MVYHTSRIYTAMTTIILNDFYQLTNTCTQSSSQIELIHVNCDKKHRTHIHEDQVVLLEPRKMYISCLMHYAARRSHLDS